MRLTLDGARGEWRQGRTQTNEGGGQAKHNRGRKIRTTLLRGIRVNPRYNPEVSARGSCGSITQNFAYRGLSGTLIAYAIVQSLRFGTEAVGRTVSTKTTVAEEFYSDLLGEEKRAEQDEGREEIFPSSWEQAMARLEGGHFAAGSSGARGGKAGVNLIWIAFSFFGYYELHCNIRSLVPWILLAMRSIMSIHGMHTNSTTVE